MESASCVTSTCVTSISVSVLIDFFEDDRASGISEDEDSLPGGLRPGDCEED